ncbi:hypothetical protein A2V71_02495 [Candidatus Berkelbacteria bacterium RBG_13_40_8]|uniref:Penicillin-binding protein transpeptidase domain-containing protein n=1 Tax=Candidatus Berkelbacteria bacterium RBG_13_40_8 TaxID=1797467 RepID=A0A1F5DNA3_9BACT|nr:MAG: hypothetical protein A2V71_02495 [Candidatus Berkelbacteria bacterium RBG_13_40_8]
MNNDSFQKRIKVLMLLTLIITLGLGYRLFQKQVLEHNSYLALAEGQYIVKKDLPAMRGKIYFSDMFPAATNTRLYQIVAVPRQIKDKEEVAQKLAPFLGLSAKEIFETINNDKYYVPPLKTHLSEEEGDKIADLKIYGVTVVPESLRYYPEGELAAQILGFVDAGGDGRYGLEGYFNNELKGIGGEVYGEKDTKGRLFDISSQLQPRNGSDFVLTLNHDIQYQAEEILKKSVEKYQSDSGSIVIADPKTGKILAMANSPAYDPNSFNKVPQDQQQIFTNDSIANAWEPGSVFKPLIMAAAINENKVQPDTTNTFGNYVTVNSYEIHTSTDKAYGKETMTQVLENSDNVAMVWVSELLGKDSMYKYLRDLGFGRKTGIELDTESTGEVKDVKQWSEAQRATISFGQGISVTPVQLLAATSAIANGGKLMQPYIVDKTIDFSGKEDVRQPKEVSRVMTEDTAKKVTEMMVSVVENGHGKKAAVSGYKVAGKTGTAQVPKPGGGYYDDRHVGSFIGFAPANDPQFIMLVRLNNPKNVDWAESSAAPTFGEMAKWLLSYFGVQPTENQEN